MPYRANPWEQSPAQSSRDAEEAYQEYIRQLNQQYQNRATGAYNTISTQQADERLSGLGLNFANDTGQQQLAASRMSGDIGQLMAQQARARQQVMMDLAQTRFSREQQKLGMADDLTRLNYQRATSQQTNPFMAAMQSLRSGGY